jgi:hypothetical protein
MRSLDPHPPLFQMGPAGSTCTVFRSNDFKTHESLSKVRHPASVRMVRGIVDSSEWGQAADTGPNHCFVNL